MVSVRTLSPRLPGRTEEKHEPHSAM